MRNRRLIIGIAVIILLLTAGVVLLRLSLFCCALPPTTPSPVVQNLPCAFQQVSQPLLNQEAAVQSTLNTLPPTISAATINAYMFGEACIHADGTTQDFRPIATDFTLSADVTGFDDTEAIGALILATLDAIDTLPADQLPAPLGSFVATFTSGAEVRALRSTFYDLTEMRLQELDGAAFIEAAGGLQAP